MDISTRIFRRRLRIYLFQSMKLDKTGSKLKTGKPTHTHTHTDRHTNIQTDTHRERERGGGGEEENFFLQC